MSSLNFHYAKMAELAAFRKFPAEWWYHSLGNGSQYLVLLRQTRYLEEFGRLLGGSAHLVSK